MPTANTLIDNQPRIYACAIGASNSFAENMSRLIANLKH
jgi:DNA-binding MurR/RpiR family transcriptional regulator